MAEIVQGKHNFIHDSVTIHGDGVLALGDCNTIHNDVNIWVVGNVTLGDYNTIHNHCFVGGPGNITIGHNNWIGQHSMLDGTGSLLMGDGNSLAYNSYVWTHIGRGEQIEGWIFDSDTTEIHNDVWLVGCNCCINPGVLVRNRSVLLANSVLSKSTLPGMVYAGIPARTISTTIKRNVPLSEKITMIQGWCSDFAQDNGYEYGATMDGCTIYHDSDVVEFSTEQKHDSYCTHFDLITKTYTKRLTVLERRLCKFLFSNKARFVPR